MTKRQEDYMVSYVCKLVGLNAVAGNISEQPSLCLRWAGVLIQLPPLVFPTSLAAMQARLPSVLV